MENENLLLKYKEYFNENELLRKNIALKLASALGEIVARELKPNVENLLKKADSLTKSRSINPDKFNYVIESVGQWRAIYAYFNLHLNSPRARVHKYYTPIQKAKRAKLRTKEGVVVSDKMNKTITVLVQRIKVHHPTGKRIRMHKKYLVHDEHEICGTGDKVIFYECKPLSRRKYHSLFERKV